MKIPMLFTLLALVLARPADAAPAARPVGIDWFEYTGNDPQQTDRLAAAEYRNPILTGFYPDPSVCRVGRDYYLINSSFVYYPGLPIFQSRDLVNWRQIGHVIDRPKQLPYERQGVSRGLFAPAINYRNGTFYVICTMIDVGGNFLVTATDPAGRGSDPTWLHFEGIDPSLFFDDDGRAGILNNGAPVGTPLYDGHRAIWIQEFDAGARRLVGPRTLLVNGGVNLSQKPVWIEGPHLYKREGWYYLCCAEGGTSVNHSQVIFRSRQVTGPYVPWEKNPILTQRPLDGKAPFAVTSTGHADLVVGPDDQWWAVFLGVRPYDGRFSPMGRETYLLPVTWTDDGWPRILESGQRVPLTAKTPGGAELAPTSVPLNGNFVWRDDFDRPDLSPLWIMLRVPAETWWKLRTVDGHGRLELTPREETLSGSGNPSFLARRVQHARFSASLSLDVPADQGVSAGLAVFQSENFHYFAAVKRNGDEATIYLERASGGAPAVIAAVRLAGAKRVQFRVSALDAKCSFEYALSPGHWQTLVAEADARILTTEVAGGFVGATVGPHARVDSPDRP